MSQSIPQKLKTEVQEFLRGKYPEDEAYRKELRFNDLYTLLQNGVAHWWFEKTDGTDRNAFGTLNKDLLEELIGENDNSSQSASGQEEFNGVLRYFDLEKMAWRGLRIDSILEIDFDYGSI